MGQYLGKVFKSPAVLFVLSLIISGFGVPSWSKILTPLSIGLGIALFWYAIKNIERPIQRFFISVVWYFCVGLIQDSWSLSTKYLSGFIILACCSFILLISIQFGLLTLLVGMKRKGLFWSVCVASIWVLFEFSRLKVACGWAFGTFGWKLGFSTVSMQLASVIGVYGLSYFVCLSNLLFYYFLLHRKRRDLIVWLSICCFPYVFGMAHLWYQKQVEKTASSTLPVQVALIKNNLTPYEKHYDHAHKAEFLPYFQQWKNIFVELKKKTKGSLDYIILHETTVPGRATLGTYPLEKTLALVQSLIGYDYKNTYHQKPIHFTQATQEGNILLMLFGFSYYQITIMQNV